MRELNKGIPLGQTLYKRVPVHFSHRYSMQLEAMTLNALLRPWRFEEQLQLPNFTIIPEEILQEHQIHYQLWFSKGSWKQVIHYINIIFNTVHCVRHFSHTRCFWSWATVLKPLTSSFLLQTSWLHKIRIETRTHIYIYIYIYIYMCVCVCVCVSTGFYSPLRTLAFLNGFLDPQIFGRTPWLRDQPDARPLPTHKTTQHRNT
jgi:hypothetical protein